MSLETDYTTVPGQIFACLSVVGPEAPQKNDKFGIKIRGAFATRDEAANHAKRLQKEDPTFDIYVVDIQVTSFLPILPDRGCPLYQREARGDHGWLQGEPGCSNVPRTQGGDDCWY